MLERLTGCSLFRIERAGENHIIVWSSGADEQLEAFINDSVSGVPEKIAHWKIEAQEATDGKYGPNPKGETIDYWRGRRNVLFELAAFLGQSE